MLGSKGWGYEVCTPPYDIPYIIGMGGGDSVSRSNSAPLIHPPKYFAFLYNFINSKKESVLYGI